MGTSQQPAPVRAQVQRQPSLSRLLGQIDRQVARRLDAILAGRGLTVDQWRALDILADGEGHVMSEIAATLVVPGATLTKIMDKLVDAALMYRLVDDRDRRRVLAFISDKGNKLHADIKPRVADAEAESIAHLGEDRQILLELLTRLAQSPQDRPARSAG